MSDNLQAYSHLAVHAVGWPWADTNTVALPQSSRPRLRLHDFWMTLVPAVRRWVLCATHDAMLLASLQAYSQVNDNWVHIQHNTPSALILTVLFSLIINITSTAIICSTLNATLSGFTTNVTHSIVDSKSILESGHQIHFPFLFWQW